MIGIIAPPNKPCKPLNNVIDRKLSEIAHPKLENIKPDKLIRKKILVDKSLISHPLKGIIMTSVISDAENTYEISSMLAFSSPCKYFNEEPTTSTLSIFKTKPLSRIKYINNFFLFIFINYTSFSDINTVDIKKEKTSSLSHYNHLIFPRYHNIIIFQSTI